MYNTVPIPTVLTESRYIIQYNIFHAKNKARDKLYLQYGPHPNSSNCKYTVQYNICHAKNKARDKLYVQYSPHPNSPNCKYTIQYNIFHAKNKARGICKPILTKLTG
uniref:Uncharacterized protein n=1 Tax=Cacopsylla melanoneura TaxID=428564 RepID=A0A8D9A946_9HEMI